MHLENQRLYNKHVSTSAMSDESCALYTKIELKSLNRPKAAQLKGVGLVKRTLIRIVIAVVQRISLQPRNRARLHKGQRIALSQHTSGTE